MTWQPIRRAGAIALAAVATWIALSVVLYLLLYRTITDIYQNQVRNVVQVDCGRWVDPPLIYTLAPGECDFSNAEFDTRIVVDADGFPNDPQLSGSGPTKVAVLGDSHALPWGVPQADGLAAVIARDPRFTVRNLSIASYGTAREMLAWRRLAQDADIVVIQYCDNDRPENAEFMRSPAGFIADVDDRAGLYRQSVKHLEERSAFARQALAMVGHGFAALSFTWRTLGLPPRSTAETPASALNDEARAFAGVLQNFRAELAGKTVVVFDSFPRRPRTAFAPIFRDALARVGMPEIKVLDLTGVLGPRDYFHIDEHMRPSGHAKIAAQIIKALGSAEPKPRTP